MPPIVALFALASVVAAGQATSQPPENVKPSGAKQSATTQDQGQSTQPINITVTTPDKSPAEQESERQREQHIDATNERIAEANDRIAGLTYWLVWVAVLEAFATAGAFWVGMRSANAAKTSADAAKESADAARQSLEISAAANIMVDLPTIAPFGPQRQIEIPIRNTGRVAATNVSGLVKQIAVHETSGVTDECATAFRDTTMMRGESRWIITAPLADFAPTAIAADQRTTGFHVVLELSYSDGFRPTPQTYFGGFRYSSIRKAFIAGDHLVRGKPDEAQQRNTEEEA